LNPQQTTAPLPAWIAQLPPEIADAVPVAPFTEAGGVLSLPQQTTAPLLAWIAQPPEVSIGTAIAEAVIFGGGAPRPHPITGPAPHAAPAARSQRVAATTKVFRAVTRTPPLPR